MTMRTAHEILTATYPEQPEAVVEYVEYLADLVADAITMNEIELKKDFENFLNK